MISAFMITYNEQGMLPRTLRHLVWRGVWGCDDAARADVEVCRGAH